MQNNNNNQTPQGVPDHRLNEMMDRLRQMELQNAQLRATIDHISKPAEPQKKESKFNPEVEQALEEFVKSKFSTVEEQFKNQLGFLADQNDELKFQLKYSSDRYEKYIPQVERIRQEQIAQGRWISREDALKHVYFEETGKKPAEAPAKIEEPKPVFSPYFNTYVDPVTNTPLSPEKLAEIYGQPQQQPQTPPPQQTQQVQQQQYDAPAWQQPVQQQQAQQPPQWQPAPTGFGQRPPVPSSHGALPPQSIHGQTPAQQRPGPIEISLESSDSQLEAFEKQYGDIPL
jgi:hypothetical protein